MPKTKQSSIVGLYFALITSCQWIYMKTIYSNKLVSWVRVCTHKNGHLFTFFFYFCLSVSRFEFRTMKKSHRNGSLYSTSSLLSFSCSIFVLFFGSDMSCVCGSLWPGSNKTTQNSKMFRFGEISLSLQLMFSIFLFILFFTSLLYLLYTETLYCLCLL